MNSKRRVDIEAFQRQKDAEIIDQISTDLMAIEKQTQAKLPEAVFKAYFLPLFAGYPTDKTVNEALWASIAGNPYRTVDIVDESGQVLFTVPPLLVRERIDPTRIDQHTSPMSHVMQTLQQLARISPIKARRYLEAEFNKRNIHQEAHEEVLLMIHQWKTIFDRYQIKHKLDVEEPNEKKQDKPPSQTSLEFDDGLL